MAKCCVESSQVRNGAARNSRKNCCVSDSRKLCWFSDLVKKLWRRNYGGLRITKMEEVILFAHLNLNSRRDNDETESLRPCRLSRRAVGGARLLASFLRRVRSVEAGL